MSNAEVKSVSQSLIAIRQSLPGNHAIGIIILPRLRIRVSGFPISTPALPFPLSGWELQ